MKRLIIISMLAIGGCAIASPDYTEQQDKLKAYHAAKVKLKIAEDAADRAVAAFEQAQLEYDTAKTEMESVKW